MRISLLFMLLAFQVQAQTTDQVTYTSLENALKQPEKVRRLDLSHQKLKSLPTSIEQLVNLEYLDLSFHKFSQFPTSILKLTKLKTLKLATYSYASQIKRIPESIRQLRALQELDISGLHLQAEPTVIYQLPSLESLRMHDIVDIQEQKDKESLAAPFQLKLMGIDQLKQLKHLDIGGQTWRQTTFPSVIFECIQLESLNISENWFTHIPNQWKALSQLQELNISGTVVSGSEYRLDYSGLTQLTQLRHLNISKIPYEEQPDILAVLPSLTKLQVLDASQSSLIEVPTQILRLAQLKQLNLSDNQLEFLPQEFQKLKQLEVVDLSQNSFEQFPPVLFEMMSLQQVFLANSMMCYADHDLRLSANIAQLTNLKRLDLSGNWIDSLPPVLDALTNLTHLDLYGCGIAYDELKRLATLPNIEYLDIGGGSFDRLPSEFGQLESLKDLRIHNTYCEGVPTGEGLEQFPEVICELRNLETVHLVGQYFKTLPSSIKRLRNLRVLGLYDCPLSALPPQITKLKQLETIDVGIYCIGERDVFCEEVFGIPKNICRLKKLRAFNYGERPLSAEAKKQLNSCLSNRKIIKFQLGK